MVELKALLERQGEIELECTSESKDRVEEWLEAISRVDHKMESALVASGQSSSWTRPYESKFEPFVEFEEDVSI